MNLARCGKRSAPENKPVTPPPPPSCAGRCNCSRAPVLSHVCHQPATLLRRTVAAILPLMLSDVPSAPLGALSVSAARAPAAPDGVHQGRARVEGSVKTCAEPAGAARISIGWQPSSRTTRSSQARLADGPGLVPGSSAGKTDRWSATMARPQTLHP